MSELKPCPFCGSKSVDAEGWRNSEGITGPACDDCGASAGGVSHSSMENVAAWNTRTSEQLERVADEMAEALREMSPEAQVAEGHIAMRTYDKCIAALASYAKWKEK